MKLPKVKSAACQGPSRNKSTAGWRTARKRGRWSPGSIPCQKYRPCWRRKYENPAHLFAWPGCRAPGRPHRDPFSIGIRIADLRINKIGLIETFSCQSMAIHRHYHLSRAGLFFGKFENASHRFRGESESQAIKAIKHRPNCREITCSFGAKKNSRRSEQGKIQVNRCLPGEFIVQNNPRPGQLHCQRQDCQFACAEIPRCQAVYRANCTLDLYPVEHLGLGQENPRCLPAASSARTESGTMTWPNSFGNRSSCPA